MHSFFAPFGINWKRFLKVCEYLLFLEPTIAIFLKFAVFAKTRRERNVATAAKSFAAEKTNHPKEGEILKGATNSHAFSVEYLRTN